MTNKILFFTALVFSSLFLSSCGIDQAKTELTDKITQTASNTPSLQPTKESVEPTLTDDQIEVELNSGAPIDIDLDADFANLEKELEQL